jgi:ubiquinone/menaquinone biosynthesis C-methylase UbiE|tara:strand:+ start:100 stop:936 length:837 start_codon:yes stop_codon:yes gene_type:complete
MTQKNNNVDWEVVKDFGVEWEEFQFSEHNNKVLHKAWEQYFNIFPWDAISKNSNGFDMGCGSGRWAQFVAPKVGKLSCIDPSSAIEVAKKNLSTFENVQYFNETSNSCSLDDNSQDFGYCLGVLHHIPNTQDGIYDCAKKLKSGAPFLLYLYYNLEDKPLLFKFIWRLADIMRKAICNLPTKLKKVVCNIIAVTVYFPLAKLSKLLEKIGLSVNMIPLSDYRDKSFYIMKNDALDRFGTKLEQRFSRAQITNMLENAGFERIIFSEHTPFWTCISYKK